MLAPVVRRLKTFRATKNVCGSDGRRPDRSDSDHRFANLVSV